MYLDGGNILKESVRSFPVFRFLICVWSPILQLLLLLAPKLMYVVYFSGHFAVDILLENMSSASYSLECFSCCEKHH